MLCGELATSGETAKRALMSRARREQHHPHQPRRRVLRSRLLGMLACNERRRLQFTVARAGIRKRSASMLRRRKRSAGSEAPCCRRLHPPMPADRRHERCRRPCRYHPINHRTMILLVQGTSAIMLRVW